MYYDQPVCILQETFWARAKGRHYGPFECFSWEESECAFLIPHRLTPSIRKEGFGRDWAALLIGTTIYVSLHILEHLVLGGRAEVALHETYLFMTYCVDNNNGGHGLDYIVGMDANTSLRYNPNIVSNLVGPGVLQPQASHK